MATSSSPTSSPRAAAPAATRAASSIGYRDAGVDLVVLGRVQRELLEYEVYASWRRGAPYDGTIAVAHADAATLRRRIGDIARPIVQRGGLVDERPTSPAPAPAATAAPPVAATAAPPARHPLLFALLLVGLICFLALPPLAARLLLGSDELARRGRPASWKWSGALIAALSLGVVAVTVVDLPALVAARTVGPVGLALAVAAGMLWGAFVLVNASWVFSPIARPRAGAPRRDLAAACSRGSRWRSCARACSSSTRHSSSLASPPATRSACRARRP